jgi:chemotaxis protein methyltransferase CheR
MPHNVPRDVPGETYFFRDPAIFGLLATEVIPALVRSRPSTGRLQFWSAGCASGEEAYSLAIVVQQVVPWLAREHVTILATDNNRTLLRKAEAGVYGDWSFRGVAPDIKDLYFVRGGDGRHAIRDDLRKLVTFGQLDLLEDPLANGLSRFDLILCRNVIMYFTPAQMRTMARRLHDALAPGGWLIVGAAETSQQIFSEFDTVVIDGRTLYRRKGVRPPAVVPMPAVHVDPPATAAPAPAAISPAATVRRLANAGQLAEALAECDRWIAAHKLDPIAYYLRGIVLAETGRADEARRALQQAIYLEPAFALAHFALAILARTAGRHQEASRYFAATLRILRRLDPHDVLPESDGMPAGRLSDMISELTRNG